MPREPRTTRSPMQHRSSASPADRGRTKRGGSCGGLRDAGADVRVILTPMRRVSFRRCRAAVSDHGVIIEQWGDSGSRRRRSHRAGALGRSAPDRAATANMIGRACDRLADDALSTYAIAHRGTIVVAPAMKYFDAPASHRPDGNLATAAASAGVIAPIPTRILACGA